jgi:hypothetical protein
LQRRYRWQLGGTPNPIRNHEAEAGNPIPRGRCSARSAAGRPGKTGSARRRPAPIGVRSPIPAACASRCLSPPIADRPACRPRDCNSRCSCAAPRTHSSRKRPGPDRRPAIRSGRSMKSKRWFTPRRQARRGSDGKLCSPDAIIAPPLDSKRKYTQIIVSGRFALPGIGVLL